MKEHSYKLINVALILFFSILLSMPNALANPERVLPDRRKPNEISLEEAIRRAKRAQKVSRKPPEDQFRPGRKFQLGTVTEKDKVQSGQNKENQAQQQVTAAAQDVLTTQNQCISIQLQVVGVESAKTRYALAGVFPQHGFVRCPDRRNPGDCYYQPDAGFTGKDTFSFTATDGFKVSGEAIVTINVGSDVELENVPIGNCPKLDQTDS